MESQLSIGCSTYLRRVCLLYVLLQHGNVEIVRTTYNVLFLSTYDIQVTIPTRTIFSDLGANDH